MCITDQLLFYIIRNAFIEVALEIRTPFLGYSAQSIVLNGSFCTVAGLVGHPSHIVVSIGFRNVLCAVITNGIDC